MRRAGTPTRCGEPKVSGLLLVFMPVVQIGIVRMLVPHRGMVKVVSMGFAHRVVCSVVVSVMFVMDMVVLVILRLVSMVVFVPLREMEPDSYAHQSGCRHERKSDRLPEQHERQRRAEEWRRREIRSGPGRAQVA
jgi:hypothetical protein